MGAGLSGSLDRIQHPGVVVARRLQPLADHLAALGRLDAEAFQHGLAFPPKLMLGVGVGWGSRRVGAQCVSIGYILLCI